MSDSTDPAVPKPAKTILVTGDVVRDVYVYKGDREYPAQSGKIPPYFSAQAGGARGLYELLEKSKDAKALWGLGDPMPLDNLQPVHALWVACQGGTKKAFEEAAKMDKPKQVWRVGEALGYALGVIRPATFDKSDAAKLHHDVIVIDDAALAFRTHPSSKLWPAGITVEDPIQANWIIHKLAAPIAQGDLWRSLIGGPNPAPRGNLIVVVSAEELRRAGAAISRGFSWEQTLTDLCAELQDNPLFEPLLRFPRALVVNFDCVAAVWFDNSNTRVGQAHPAYEKATLVYDPTLQEGGWKTCLMDEHSVYGHLNTFTAAIALAAARADRRANPKSLPDFNSAIRRGLTACRQLRLKGHGEVSVPKPGPPLDDLAPLLAENSKDFEKSVEVLCPQGYENISGAKHDQGAAAHTWTLAALAENPSDRSHLPLYGLAHRVALRGLPELARIPHAHFGDLLSVDRSEMETLRGLTHLIQRYEKKKQPKQPLSIATFGPPGAGKSFGIIQIAKAVLDLQDDNILTFNLSQFSEASDLFGAFHQVRDNVLTGAIPVVFWDEFDSRNYKWLQYLLAPMQDGAFEENGHTHTIGKCIFVFAGATSWDFDRFGPAPLPDGWKDNYGVNLDEALESGNPEIQALAKRYQGNEDLRHTEEAARVEFRQKKGPDFLSRLDGHIDVLGPNPRLTYNWTTRTWNVRDPHDITFPLRRALLLRQFLGAKKAKDTLSIDRDLLRAFLLVPKYRHGARSLEKIARHLALSQAPFRRADLPPPQVLEQHLDSAAEFDNIYHETQSLLTPQVIDSLASAINEGYNNDNPAAAKTPFNQLDPFIQQSNRAAALRIPYVLALAGLRLVKRKGGAPKINLGESSAVKGALDRELTTEESIVLGHIVKHVEILAEEEHRLWIQFHEENGWTFGFKLLPKAKPSYPDVPVVPFEKDKANLKHPCMSEFHKMPNEYGQRKGWQDYDRHAVQRYPRILRLTDFEIAFAEP